MGRSFVRSGAAQCIRYAALAALCWLTFAIEGTAAPPAESATPAPAAAPGSNGRTPAEIALRRILVPAEHLPALLERSPGAWHIMDAGEFNARLTAAELPAALQIDEAIYHAEFTGDSFSAGTLFLTLSDRNRRETASSPPGRTPQLLWLDPTNLAFDDLSWEDAPAIWGSDRSGRTAALVEEGRNRLAGSWSLSGRRIPGSVEFNLRIPRATVSRFELAVPDSHLLRSSTADAVVSGPLPGPRKGWDLWRVDAGSRTELHLSVAQRAGSPGRMRPVVLSRNETSYVLRADGLDFLCDFHFEVAGSEVRKLRFAMPASAEILSIEYRSSRRRTGSGPAPEDALAWTSFSDDGVRMIEVTLPDPVLGPAPRPVRVRGFAPPRLGRRWTLPRSQLVAAPDYDMLFLEGRSTLQVEPPLEVRSLSSPGARQIGAEADGRSFTFQRFRSIDPRQQGAGGLIVDADHPRPALTARVWTAVQFDPETWTASTRIDWRAEEGSAFSMRCEIPDGWRIVEVRPVGDVRRSSITGWSVAQEEVGPAELRVEFRDALVPENAPGKSIHVVAQRLAAPTGEAFAIPALRPLDCKVIETVVALSCPGTSGPRLRDAVRTRIVRAGDLPEPAAGSSFWQEVMEREGALSWLRAAGEPDGVLVVPTAGSPVQVRARTDLSLDTGTLSERFTLKLTPHGAPVDRLLVYLATAADDLSWRVEPPGGDEIDVVTLPPERHEEWDLPADGVLQEVRLSSPHTGKFTLSGVQSRPFARAVALALPFVPGAWSFRGTVVVDPASETTLAIEEEGKPTGAATRDYVRPDASLRATRRLQHGEAAGWAALALYSRLSPDEAAFDEHRAVFRIPAESAEESLSFRLPDGAELLAVRVGSSWIPPAFEIPLEPDRPNVVTIEYRTRPSAGWGTRTHEVPTPRTPLDVLLFDWTIALPRGIHIAADPERLALLSKLPEPAWTERIFGPLGRPADLPFFNPFLPSSWRGLFGGRAARDEVVPPTLRTEAGGGAEESAWDDIPAGWRTVKASAPYLPEQLSIRTRDEGQAVLAAWTLLLAIFLAGVAVRLLRFRWSAPLGVIVTSAAFAIAWAAPPAWSPFAGSAFAGCILAVLVPVELFRRISTPRPPESGMGGSTATFQHAVATGLLLAGCAIGLGRLVEAASAQEPAPARSAEAGAAATPPSGALPAGGHRDSVVAAEADVAGESLVLIPVNQAGEPAAELGVVYVNEPLRERLARLAVPADGSPSYLISHADYRARIDSRYAATIDAQFDVVLLPGAAAAEVLFPLLAANPGGAEACRVDGVPVPLVPLPGGRSFTVAVSRPEQIESPRRVNVAFKLHPPVSRTPGFDIEVPPVAASRVELTFESTPPAVRVPSARGAVSVDEEASHATADLGGSDRLSVRWPAARDARIPAAPVETSVLCDVDVRPTWIEYRYRISCRAGDRPIDYLSWIVPRTMILRSASIEGVPLSAAQLPHDDNRSQVLLTLPAPRGGEFLVEVTFIAAATEDPEGIAVPLGQWRPEGAETASIPYRVGVRTAPEFRLVPGERDAAAAPIAPDSFPDSGALAGAMKRPQFAYDLRGPALVRFLLEPLTPLRRVRQYQAGRIGRESIIWRMKAEVEATGAPAYRHTLIADPRLRIRSISVEEADVERLVRWSRDGDRIHLFLDRGTTAVQQVVIAAELPLNFREETSLPELQFEDAIVRESRVELAHDAGVTVELPASAAAERIDAAPVIPEIMEPGDAPIGKFARPAGAPPIRIRAFVHERPRVDTLTVLGHAERASSDPRAERLRLTSVIRIFPPAEGAAPYRLRIPPALAADYQLETAGCRPGPPVERPDGAVEMPLETDAEFSGASATVALTCSISPPSGDWTLPRIELLDSIDGKQYLVLPPEFGWSVEEASGTSGDALPGWVAPHVVASPAGLPQVYRGGGTLTRRPAGLQAGPVSIDSLWTQVWQRGSDRDFGMTIAELPPRQRGRLEWDWPADCLLLAVFLDGASVTVDPPRGDDFLLPIEPGTRTVALYWSRPASPPPALMRRLSPAFPLPRATETGRSYLSIVSDRGVHLFSRGGLAAEDVPAPAFAPVPEQLRAAPRSESFSGLGDPAVEGRLVPNSGGAPSPSFWAIRSTAAIATAAAAVFLLVAASAWRMAPPFAGWLRDHPAAAWALLGFVWWWWLKPAIVALILLAASLWLVLRRPAIPAADA